jgi:hypothetical protein
MKRFLKDPSFYILLISNIWPLKSLLVGELLPGDIYWSYLGQSFIIICVWTIRLVLNGYGRIGTGGLLGIQVKGTVRKGRYQDENDYSAAGLFFTTWSLATFVYSLFALVFFGEPRWAQVSWPLGGFAIANLASVLTHGWRIDPAKVNKMISLRAIPMHFAVIFGGFLPSILPALVLMTVKTVADVTVHALDHADR